MKRFILICLFIPLVFLGSGCPKKKPTGPSTGGFQFVEIDDVLANPLKGFAPWIGVGNAMFQERLQQATFGWRDLEPQKGVYNWSHLEKNWGNIAVTGKRVGFRVAAEIPGSGQGDTPQWLIDEGVAMRPYSIDGHTGWIPDWDDPRFLAAHHDFITALGDRYDHDPRVAWIDIGSYGFWGEWHVWLNESLAGTQATKQAILEDYYNAFPTKLKVIAFDDDFATQYVTDRGGGIRNDCLGTEDANDWYMESLNRIDPDLNETVWKTALITGEFCGSDWGAIEGTTTRFDLNFDFVKRTHWSFIGSAGGAILPQNDEHRDHLQLLHKTLGYRFVLKSADFTPVISAGGNLDLRLQVENKGIAPFYLDWTLILYCMSGDTVDFQTGLDVDIRDWLPGTHTENVSCLIPGNISAGSYELRLAIPDPDYEIKGILFANTQGDEKGRFLIGYLDVL